MGAYPQVYEALVEALDPISADGGTAAKFYNLP
jgi:hypothetical protein